jgi:hypothetical protein
MPEVRSNRATRKMARMIQIWAEVNSPENAALTSSTKHDRDDRSCQNRVFEMGSVDQSARCLPPLLAGKDRPGETRPPLNESACSGWDALD